MIEVIICYTRENRFIRAYIQANADGDVLYTDNSYYSSIYLLYREINRVLKALKIKAYWIRSDCADAVKTIIIKERM